MKLVDLNSNIKDIISNNIFLVILVIGFSNLIQAQERQRIIIENANNQVTDGTTDTIYKYFNGEVRAYHKGNFIFCDTAIMINNDLNARGNVSVIQHDTTKIYGKQMMYYGDLEKATLIGDVIIESGENKLYTSALDYDLKLKQGTYEDGALLENKEYQLRSKRGRYDVNNDVAYFYEQVSITGDSLKLINDSLIFNTQSEIAYWHSPTRIVSGNAHIYSEEGFYDLKKKQSEFKNNAQYQEDDKITTADSISYDDSSKAIGLFGSAFYTSKTEIAQADTIYYNSETGRTELIGNACFKNQTNSAVGERIIYNKITEEFSLRGRGTINDSSMIITANHLDYDKLKNIGKASGNVIWQDTSSKTTIISDSMDYRGDDHYFKAINKSGRPKMIIEIDGDSLLMLADTIKSDRRYVYRDSIGHIWTPKVKANIVNDTLMVSDSTKKTNAIIPINVKEKLDPVLDTAGIITASKTVKADSIINDSDTLQIDVVQQDKDSVKYNSNVQVFAVDTFATIDTIDYMIGDNHVEIYKSDLQAVCDSLVYNTTDSLFILIDRPLMWTDTTQLKGDTIYMYLKDKKISHLDLLVNSLVISTEDYNYYNQIGGKKIVATFENNELRKMKVDGNATALYYMLDDDKAYIGVNKTEASFIIFEFFEKKIDHIKSYINPTSIIYPIEGTNHEELKLKGFEWREEIRPKREQFFIWDLFFNEE